MLSNLFQRRSFSLINGGKTIWDSLANTNFVHYEINGIKLNRIYLLSLFT